MAPGVRRAVVRERSWVRWAGVGVDIVVGVLGGWLAVDSKDMTGLDGFLIYSSGWNGLRYQDRTQSLRGLRILRYEEHGGGSREPIRPLWKEAFAEFAMLMTP